MTIILFCTVLGFFVGFGYVIKNCYGSVNFAFRIVQWFYAYVDD